MLSSVRRLPLKRDGTRAETRFRLSAKRTSPFKSAGASVQSTTAAEVLASAVVMLGTSSSDVVRRVQATHSTRQFPLHFPSRVSLCAIRFQLDSTTWCFSDCASWIDYILTTNLMHWLLFIHKIIFSSTCFEPQVLIFRRIQLYTCSVRYCHSLWEFLVVCRYTAWVCVLCTDRPPGALIDHREWQYHMLHVYNCIILKMSTWGSKHVEENTILWINNNQCIKLVINV